MPHFAASDLGLICLHMSHKKDTRLIWVKIVWPLCGAEYMLQQIKATQFFVSNFAYINLY